jgi:hypothetical protein
MQESRTYRWLLGFVAVAIVVLAGGAVFLAAASSIRRHNESVQCGNCMASIGCAARLWAGDHDGHLPSDLLSLSNELNTTRLLVCPGDRSRQPAASWESLTSAQSSYEVVTPRLRDGDTNGVFLRCKVHGHLGYADATVFDGTRRRTNVVW